MATGLATRCSACGTVFRVVPDQLRVSEGWVRCGRCSQVFNALEGLVDLDTGLPKQTAGSMAHAGADAPAEADFEFAHPAARPGSPPLPPAATAAPAGRSGEAPSPRTVRARTPAWAAPVAGSAAADGGGNSNDLTATAADVSVSGRLDGLRRSSPTEQAGNTAAANAALNAAPEAASGATANANANANAGAAADANPEAADKPSFVRSAERAERWRSPKVRAALAATAVLATLTLLTQASLQYRDVLAAQVPETRPWLDQACATLGCRVEAARAIENLAVDSSGLVRVEKSNLYKLQVTLRNRGGMDVAVPALDLTLSDGQGRLIARKVLRLSELGASQATIAAGRELAVLATVQAAANGDVAQQPIAGYTIELFYP